MLPRNEHEIAAVDNLGHKHQRQAGRALVRCRRKHRQAEVGAAAGHGFTRAHAGAAALNLHVQPLPLVKLLFEGQIIAGELGLVLPLQHERNRRQAGRGGVGRPRDRQDARTDRQGGGENQASHAGG